MMKSPIDSRPEAKPKALAWDRETTIRFWNYYSGFPELYFATLFGANLIQRVGRYLPKRARIIDYAAGTGALTGLLLDVGKRVASLDLSSAALEKIADRYKKYENFMGTISAQELGSIRGSFDAAMLVELIEHVDDAILKKVLADVRGALVPGGLVVITTPNDENLGNETVYCPCCNQTFHRWQHVRSWSAESLTVALRKHGFEVVAMFTVDLSLSPRNGIMHYLLRRFFDLIRSRKLPHLIGIGRKVV